MNGSMKESAVRDFMLNYDFSNESWSIKEIKSRLRQLLGEEPAIKVNYQKDVMVNEITGNAKEISKLTSIEIIFTNLDDNIKKLEFKLD